jgi:hypothetical protein
LIANREKIRIQGLESSLEFQEDTLEQQVLSISELRKTGNEIVPGGDERGWLDIVAEVIHEFFTTDGATEKMFPALHDFACQRGTLRVLVSSPFRDRFRARG